MFTPDPIPRPSGPPASSAPVRDYLASPRPGADAGYVVVPRSLAEAMPLPWQQHMTYLLSEFHQAFSHVTWPAYRVVPSRYEKLVDLDEEQLAEVGAMVEIDTDGEVVYRDRAGRIIEHPEQKSVMVSCLDPIPPPQSGPPQPGPPPPGTPQPGPLPGMAPHAATHPGAPVGRQSGPQSGVHSGPPPVVSAPQDRPPMSQDRPPMSQDRPPAPQDRPPGSANGTAGAEEEPPDTPPTGFPVQTPGPPVAPDQPFGPTGYQQRRPGSRRW